MIVHKICMLGTFGVGKTSLVARFVRSMFTDKYFTTVGVRVDKKPLTVNGRATTLALWDLAGEDALTQVKAVNLRGASGYILVMDGCRMSTLTGAVDLHGRFAQELEDLPFTCVVNKLDLRASWEIDEAAIEGLRARSWPLLLTSAKTGEGVEALFMELAERMLARADRLQAEEAALDAESAAMGLGASSAAEAKNQYEDDSDA